MTKTMFVNKYLPYMFLLFLCGGIVLQFVVLTSIMNHVRMFVAVRAHRNEVRGVIVSNQQAMILRREKKVAYHMMVLSAALLICLVPAGLLRAFQSSFVQLRRYLFPWTLSFLLINASVMINFWWNKELRSDKIACLLLKRKHNHLPFQITK